MANQVDILFNATVNDSDIEELIKKLQEIESMGVIDLKNVGADIEKAKKELDGLKKKIKEIKSDKEMDFPFGENIKKAGEEVDKVNKNILEQERAKQQIIMAQNKGLSKSQAMAEDYLKTLKEQGKVSAEEWAKLKTLMDSESQKVKISNTHMKYLAEQDKEITAEKIKNMNKIHEEALKIEKARSDMYEKQSNIANQSSFTKSPELINMADFYKEQEAEAKKSMQRQHAEAIKMDKERTNQSIKEENSRIDALNSIIKNANEKAIEEQKNTDKLISDTKIQLAKEDSLKLLQINNQIKDAQTKAIEEQKKADKVVENQIKLKQQEEKETQKLIELEQKRLNQLNELRRKVEGSDIANKSQITKDLYILEKRLSQENWENELTLVKENFNAKVKYEKEFRALEAKEEKEAQALKAAEEKRQYDYRVKLAETLDKTSYAKNPIQIQMSKMYAEDERIAKEQQQLRDKQHTEAIKMDKARTAEQKKIESAHTQAIAENIKRQQQLRKQAGNDEVRNRKTLEQIKLNLIKTNLYAIHKEELIRLQQQKTINKSELDSFKKTVDEQIAKQQGARAEFTQNLSQMMAIRQVGNYVKGTIREFETFEDSLFQTGMIAGRSAIEIRGMRNEILEMGLNIPRTTQEILDNITAIQRTGRSYEEAGQIINSSAKLAVTAGESIALSTDVLNKALIAFDINVSQTSKVMDIFYTASVKSPLDLQKISDGLKNSASSMRNFIEATDKSGQELEDYKMRLLAMNTALLGGQSAMGRQASSSGMSIRTNTNVLFLSDKVA